MWSLGAQATELLFDAGQRHALTDQARQQYEAQAAAYRNTVFQAFQDVEDNLSSLRILDEETAVEQKAVAAAQRSFDTSNQRYKGGVTGYLEVLTAEATLLTNQRTLDGSADPAVCCDSAVDPRPRRRMGFFAASEIRRVGSCGPS